MSRYFPAQPKIWTAPSEQELKITVETIANGFTVTRSGGQFVTERFYCADAEGVASAVKKFLAG